jgi:two-component system, NarL family, nitrate/nitrite response regulator NarL
MHGKATVVLFGGGRLYREALKRLLVGPEIAVESEWDDLQAAVAHVGKTDPDLLIAVGDSSHDELVELRAALRSGRLVQLASSMTLAALRDALKVGVDAYLVDGMSPRALRAAVGLALHGEKVLPSQIVSMLLNDRLQEGRNARDHWRIVTELSSREVEILGRLVDGEPNKVIATQLDISEATVKVHLKAALKKIKASNRTQAAVWALQHGLRPHPPNASS